MKVLASALLAATIMNATAAAQNQPPAAAESVDVNVVAIDATVTDRQGNPILGLEPDDFVVEENGSEIAVESADYFTSLRLLDRNKKNAPFRVDRVREERYFIFFLHKEGVPTESGLRGELLRTRDAIAKFVDERMLPGDRAAIAAFDVRLKLFSDLTSDRAVLRRALNDAVTFGNGISASVPSEAAGPLLANIDFRRMRDDTGTVLEAIEFLVEALRPVRGRKNLILFSAGVGEPSRFNPMFIENISHAYDPMIAAAHSSNVVLHTVNLRNRIGVSPREELLSRMAGETGGTYNRNVINFNTPLRDVDRANAGYYLLTYTIRKPAGVHAFQKVEVRTRNPEFRVTARAGYSY